MKKTFEFNYLVYIIISSLLFCSFSLRADQKAVEVFVNNISSKALAIINNKDESEPQKEVQLGNVFSEATDLDWIAKFSLGRYWRTATDEERKQYLALYRKYIISKYVPSFKEYVGTTFKIVNITVVRKGEYLVDTTVIKKGQAEPIDITYHIADKSESKSGFTVFDIIAEGVSLIATQRSEFSSIITSSGMTGLLNKLEKLITNPSLMKQERNNSKKSINDSGSN
jgi:phospholipid transport system substrate-binding protein